MFMDLDEAYANPPLWLARLRRDVPGSRRVKPGSPSRGLAVSATAWGLASTRQAAIPEGGMVGSAEPGHLACMLQCSAACHRRSQLRWSRS